MSEAVLDWKVHPFSERPLLGWGVLAGITGLSILAGIWGGAWFWTLLSFAVLFLSLESFYFPTRFILEEEKLVVIRRFSRSEREWSVFRRCMVDGQGITLSPFKRSSWLEAYRAIRLRFAPGNREAVLAFIEERLGAEVDWIQDPRWKRNKKET